MRIVMFYHSIVSDWNHGNAHFLRGVVTELLERGHQVRVYEPRDGWSYSNLLKEKGGAAALVRFQKVYPRLQGIPYLLKSFDADRALAGADLVIVHEWNEPELVNLLGSHRRKQGGYRLLFHDTHHRSVTDASALARYDLSAFDGALVYGRKIEEIYRQNCPGMPVWVWHEAADVRVFHPLQPAPPAGDVVWIGNWGDEERSEEIREFFIEPVRRLGLRGMVYGVRYPEPALRLLARAGIRYGGWLPNFEVPGVFSRYRLTVHIPRRPYVTALPGIPTIRPFEALACGIPLLSAPWQDTDRLFSAGKDFLYAQSGAQMANLMSFLLRQPKLARQQAEHGRQTILCRHTCGHRVDQLLEICKELARGG